MMRTSRSRALALVLILGLASPGGAQEVPAAAGTVVGRVVDATTGQPVPEALVTLEPAVPGLLVDPATSLAVTTRATVTGADGAYRFPDVGPGRYRLRIERIGYRTAAVELDVRRPAPAHVSVGLELEPVALRPLSVRGRAASQFQRAAGLPIELEEARVASERHRQALFLAPDARMLTYADVMDGVTLGEGDVFRALQRFPGVATRDDYTAELWTRGAPWTQTQVTFDGVPLFNPVHAVGVLSAFTPEVLGAVFFHPGVPPAEARGGAAGLVDLRTRPAAGDGSLKGVVDLSLASSKLALEREVLGASGVIAARRSHLGVLTQGLGRVGLDTVDLPYVFRDVAGRVDIPLGGRALLEASGLWEEDRLEGDVEGVVERTEARWGNAAGRTTLRTDLGGAELSHTVGMSRFSASSDERLVRVREPVPPWTEPASRNEVRHARVAGELAPARGDGATRWSLGWDVVRESVRYDGPLPRYQAAQPDTIHRLLYERDLTVGVAWAQARLAAGSIELSPGARIEAGSAPANAGPVRVAPRVAVRWRASPEQSVSLSLGRSWQYVQAMALAGPSIHPAFHASHFWVLAGEDAPAIRSDLVSLGAERWLGPWLASATVYARRAAGMTVPDPTPGPLTRRPVFVTGKNTARGVDLGLRRIGLRWSTSFGYSWGVSEIEAGGRRYPAPADRRHVLDGTAAVALPADVRLALAYTGMSGAPFTRAVSRSPGDCTLFGFGCGTEHAVVQEPNAERTPDYRSIDLSVHWTRAVGLASVTAYVQVRNLLGRDNASTYSGTLATGRQEAPSGARVLFEDRFEQALPRLPLVGLRVAF